MELRHRDTQTQVKHRILQSYADAWAGIILNGVSRTARDMLRKGRPFKIRLIYVDSFAYKGRYLGDRTDLMLGAAVDEPVWGSPIIGVKSLDTAREFAKARYGFEVETAAYLFEASSDNCADLLENLTAAGFGHRIVTNRGVVALPQPNVIYLHCGNCLDYMRDLLTVFRLPYTKVLAFLDPYGATGIPYSTIRDVVSQPNVDTLINFPYQDLHKKQGILNRDRELPSDAGLLENFDAMYGTHLWREVRNTACGSLASDAQRDLRTRALEQALTEFYADRLQDADPRLVVKNIRMEFPDRDRAMFYLYLTTHDATGAIKMNEVLDEARLSQYILKQQYKQAKRVYNYRKLGQVSLFDLGVDDVASASMLPRHSVNPDELGDFIWSTFVRDTEATLRDVYRFLANTDVFHDDIGRALASLKKRGLADYDRLSIDSNIQFSAKGSRT